MKSFGMEAIVYVLFGGVFQASLATLVLPLFLLVARRFGAKPLMRLVDAQVLFQFFLLCWGCLGHYAFLSMTYGRLYVSADRLVDCLPFVPFGQWVLDQDFVGTHGHLMGDATLWQLQLIWLAVAVPVWLLTYISTRIVLRLMPPRPSVSKHSTSSSRGSWIVKSAGGGKFEGRIPKSEIPGLHTQPMVMLLHRLR